MKNPVNWSPVPPDGRRKYPACCTSEYCGKVEPECRSCPSRQYKDAFDAWREETQAVCVDPVWSPLWYQATRPKGGA